MKFKIDENLPAEIAQDLRDLNHDAHTVIEELLAGTNDDSLLMIIQREKRALITMDKGIANIRVYPPNQYDGIILLRPSGTGKKMVLEFARKHLPAVLQKNLQGRLFVISETGIRSRPH